MANKADETYMREALKEAERALNSKDTPVGAVIVHGGKIIARAHHQVRLLKDPTAHATIIAITQAASTLQSDNLDGACIYVTKEPSAMSIGAVLLSGASRLVYGAEDRKAGACGSVVDLPGNERLNRKMVVVRDVLAADCYTLLRKSSSGGPAAFI